MKIENWERTEEGDYMIYKKGVYLRVSNRNSGKWKWIARIYDKRIPEGWNGAVEGFISVHGFTKRSFAIQYCEKIFLELQLLYSQDNQT